MSTNRLSSIFEPHPEAPKFIDPVGEHVNWAVLRDNARVGLTTVVIEMTRADYASAPGVAEAIGQELLARHVGEKDWLTNGELYHIFCYVVRRQLHVALRIIHEELARLGIATSCRIAVADPEAQVWRQFDGIGYDVKL
jgi:hypothetical protein